MFAVETVTIFSIGLNFAGISLNAVFLSTSGYVTINTWCLLMKVVLVLPQLYGQEMYTLCMWLLHSHVPLRVRVQVHAEKYM